MAAAAWEKAMTGTPVGGTVKTALVAFLSRAETAARPTIVVSVSAAAGSTPREVGAMMAVTGRGVAGTIGGGRLEHDAIKQARRMLRDGRSTASIGVPLGPAIGQCCGGHVTLIFERVDAGIRTRIMAAEAVALARRPAVFIHGAGHVGKALALALAPLPLAVTLADERPGETLGLRIAGVGIRRSPSLVRLAEEAPPGAAHVILTHSHALDARIAAAVLERGDAPYLGLIGSATKRALFIKGFREIGIPEARVATISCPIGGSSLRDKRPAVIAALTAAEIAKAMLKDGGAS
jgi:xanthine dehydrogenase accessory factor/xanthine dehydrogenase large subunit